MRVIPGRPVLARAAAVALLAVVSLVAAAPASAARVNYRAEADDGPRKFFDSGGLELRGECEFPPLGISPELEITVDTDFPDAMLHFNGQSQPPEQSVRADYNQEDEFNPGDDIGLFAPEGEGGLGAGHSINSSGQIVYSRPGGVNVTVDWIADSSAEAVEGEGGEPGPYGETFDCMFVAHARVVDSGSSRINFRSGVIGDPVTILDQAGLRLRADCNPDNTGGADPDNDPELSVEAVSKTENMTLHANSQSLGDGHGFNQNDNLDANGVENLFDSLAGRDSAGQLIYAKPAGPNVSVDWMAHEGDGLYGSDRCVFTGNVRKRSPGDRKRVNYRPSATGLEETTFFSRGGLRLAGRCVSQMSGPALTVRAISGSNHAVIHANSQSVGPEVDYGESDNFNKGDNDSVDVIRKSVLIGSPRLLPTTDQTSGQLVYSTEAGRHVVIDWLAEEVGAFGGTKPCAFVGTAEVSKP